MFPNDNQRGLDELQQPLRARAQSSLQTFKLRPQLVSLRSASDPLLGRREHASRTPGGLQFLVHLLPLSALAIIPNLAHAAEIVEIYMVPRLVHLLGIVESLRQPAWKWHGSPDLMRGGQTADSCQPVRYLLHYGHRGMPSHWDDCTSRPVPDARLEPKAFARKTHIEAQHP